MAETNLEIIVRVLGAREASTEISQVGRSTAQVGKHTEEASKKTSALGSTLKTLAGGFLVYKGAQFIKNAVSSTNELARQTYALQKITGMDAQTSAGWIALAKERGIQTRQLNMSFITLAKQSQKLSEGSKATVKEFDRMGISAKQWQSLNMEGRLELLATKFQQMKNPAERAALAQTMFGRGAQVLIPLLARGKDAVHNMVGEMGKASGVTNTSVKEQMKLVVAQRQMHMAMLALSMAISQSLAPVLVGLSKILVPITTTFALAMQHSKLFRDAVIALSLALGLLIVYVKAYKLATSEAITQTKLAAAAQWLWNVAMDANPVGLVIVAIVALIGVFVLLYTKVKWVREAVADVWKWIKANWPLLVGIILLPFVGPIGIIVALFHKQLLGTAENVFNTIKGIVESVAGVFKNVLATAIQLVLTPLEKMVQLIEKAINLGKKIGGGIAGAASGAVGEVTSGFGLFHQTGGWMSHAGTAIVGEAGPEMLHLPQGTRISPSVQSYRGSGATHVIQVPVYLDRRQIALALGSFTADMAASR
jgi:hypothetical protein